MSSCLRFPCPEIAQSQSAETGFVRTVPVKTSGYHKIAQQEQSLLFMARLACRRQLARSSHVFVTCFAASRAWLCACWFCTTRWRWCSTCRGCSTSQRRQISPTMGECATSGREVILLQKFTVEDEEVCVAIDALCCVPVLLIRRWVNAAQACAATQCKTRENQDKPERTTHV